MVSASAIGQVDQPDEPAGAVNERANRGAVDPPGDEIALPVTDPGALLDDLGAPIDQHSRGHEARAALISATASLPQRLTGAQLRGVLPTQPPRAAVVEAVGSVDGPWSPLSTPARSSAPRADGREPGCERVDVETPLSCPARVEAPTASVRAAPARL